MDTSFDPLLAAAGFGAFWALVLGAVVVLRWLAGRAPLRRGRGR